MSNTATKNLLLSQNKASQPSEYSTPPKLTYQIFPEGEELIVHVEVPGVNPEEVSVFCDSSILYVSCDRGSISLPIDASLDTNDIKADIKWGLLTLTVPRRAARSVKINIFENSVKKAPEKVAHSSSKSKSSSSESFTETESGV